MNKQTDGQMESCIPKLAMLTQVRQKLDFCVAPACYSRYNKISDGVSVSVL